MDIQVISIVVTILLALAGYWITKRNEIDLARRQERLQLVNRMINEFYGPLYVATKSGSMAHKALTDKIGVKDLFPVNRLPQEPILKEWQAWVTDVFIPMNQIREDIIVNNAHLIREKEMPQCLLKFIVHASAYKAMVAKWKKGDFSEYLPILGFPQEIDDYATKSYNELKEEQARLIGRI